MEIGGSNPQTIQCKEKWRLTGKPVTRPSQEGSKQACWDTNVPQAVEMDRYPSRIKRQGPQRRSSSYGSGMTALTEICSNGGQQMSYEKRKNFHGIACLILVYLKIQLKIH